MIKNIVFDMGGVLIDFNPDKTLAEFFPEDVCRVLLKEIFRNEIWNEKDRGTVSGEEIIEMKKRFIPDEYFSKVRELVINMFPYMKPFEKMYEVVKTLKYNGYKIYLLSNAGYEFHEERKNIPALTLFDGVIISADYKITKPEEGIYLKLYEKFNLNPEECFFIDDVQKNIDGALATGMRGHCYSHGDTEILKEALRENGVRI